VKSYFLLNSLAVDSAVTNHFNTDTFSIIASYERGAQMTDSSKAYSILELLVVVRKQTNKLYIK